MKKAIKQSTLMYFLNITSGILIVFTAIAFIINTLNAGSIANANTDRIELTYNANRFMNGSAYLTNEVRAYSTTGDKSHYDNYWNEINNLKNREIGVSNMQEIGITDNEKSMIDQMSALSNQLVPLEEEAMKNVQDGKLKEAIGYVYGASYTNQINQINTIKEQFLTELDSRTAAEIAGLGARAVMLQVTVFILAITILIMQLISFYMTRKKIIIPIIAVQNEMLEISHGNLSSDFNMEPDSSEIGMLIDSMISTRTTLKKYISDLNDKLSKMADGDMNLLIDVDYAGDFAPIKNALNTILQSLNSTLGQINQASEQVSAGSDQVSSGAQALSQGATEQASSVEELAATINEISSQIKGNATNSQKASKEAEQAGFEMVESNKKMQALIEAMGEISNSSQQISKVIKTIEDIAFQTNILALNAAVEAARAGTAGKGFAVVADEVRNLASKSAEAAKSTTSLIEGSILAVENGTTLANDTAKSFDVVVGNATTVSGIVSKISKASIEQANSIAQVTQGIDQISAVVQTNSATAEESAAASEELSGQASMLKQLVGKFKLNSTLTKAGQ